MDELNQDRLEAMARWDSRPMVDYHTAGSTARRLQAEVVARIVGRVFAGIGRLFTGLRESFAQGGFYRELAALEDWQLAGLGIQREEIPHYVERYYRERQTETDTAAGAELHTLREGKATIGGNDHGQLAA